MADNPSVVNDESGNNYGGIGTGLMGQAQMQYLENLQRLALKTGPSPMRGDQYTPGGSDVNIGQVSGSIIGSQPIFAAGNLIPFAMLDEMKRSQLESEKEYYKNFKTYLDKPLSNITAKLDNPWAQPEFNTKIQQITDQMLDAYASKFGGNYMQAQVALQNDKNFHRTLEGFAQYADIYNNVYKEAISTLAKKEDTENFYVSDDQVASINKFLHSHDQLENLSIEQLGKNAEEFAAKMSVFKLAEAATAGVKEDVRSYFEKNPDANLSNDEQEAWIKTKITGDKDQVKSIVDTTVKANPWLKKDPDQLALFTQEVRNRVKYGVEQEVQLIRKENADRDQELKKYGIRTDTDGNIQFDSKPAALVNAQGNNAVNYNTKDLNPIPSVVGMTGYVVINGKLRYVKLPESYNMLPQSEYDITDPASGVSRGRYVESRVNFQSVGPYKPDDTRAASKSGKITQYTLGTERGTEEKLPAVLEDALTGEQLTVYGEQTMLTPFDQMKGTVEGNIPYMSYVHDKLEVSYGPFTKRMENLEKGGNRPASYAKPIDIPSDADMSFIKDDPFVKYNWEGKVASGKEIWDASRAASKK